MKCFYSCIYILCSLFSVNVAGLVVGLTFGVIFLLCIVGVPICIGVVICYTTNKSSHRPLRTHVVATTPATGATVVTSNQTTSTANPNLYAQPQYPQQPQPPVLYSQPQYPQQPQQPVYKDAQLSFQEAPPSYDAVTTAANTTQQIPLVICLLFKVHVVGTSVHIMQIHIHVDMYCVS